MFNIQKRLQNKTSETKTTVDLRQRLLQKEFENLSKLPDGCSLKFDNPDVLSQFKVVIVPDKDSYWNGGLFEFVVNVPESYNMEPPKVHCLTKIWHPNINEKGDVCLSILRQNAIDSYGWLPTRTIIEVIFGINSLFYVCKKKTLIYGLRR